MPRRIKIKPGYCYRISGNHPERIHVRAVIDNSHVVYAFWRKGFWSYTVDSLHYLGLLYKNGVLHSVGNSLFLTGLPPIPYGLLDVAFLYKRRNHEK